MAPVFTKIDKQNQREVAATVNRYRTVLSETWDELPQMILTSSVTRFGRDRLLQYIDDINQQLKSNETTQS